MRASEFVTEAIAEVGKVHPDHASVFNKSVYYPGMAGHYYDMYRMGVDIAAQTNGAEMEAQRSAIANNLMFAAYTDEELEMIKNTSKNFGQTPVKITGKKSAEPDAVNTTSPTQSRGPIKRRK